MKITKKSPKKEKEKELRSTQEMQALKDEVDKKLENLIQKYSNPVVEKYQEA